MVVMEALWEPLHSAGVVVVAPEPDGNVAPRLADFLPCVLKARKSGVSEA